MKQWYHIAIALIVLGGLVWFLQVDIEKERATEEQEEKESLFLQYDWSKLAKLTIKTSKTEVGFVSTVSTAKPDASEDAADQEPVASDQRSWTIVEPFAAEADSANVRNYIQTLQELKIEKEISDAAEDLSVFGLDTANDDVLIFRLTDSDARVVEVHIGSLNPGDSGNYAKLASAKKIYLVEQRLNYLHDKELKFFREKSLLSYVNTDVKKIVYKWQSKPGFILEKQQGQWQLLQPFAAVGDSVKINSFLADIKNVRIDDFPSEQADSEAQKYGFDKPQGEVTLSVKREGTEPEEEMHTITVGAFDADERTFFARKNSSNSVYQIEKLHRDKLDKVFGNFVQHDLGNFVKGDVQTINIEAKGEKPIRVGLQEESGWHFQQKDGQTFRADSDKSRLLIRKLRQLGAKEFVSKEPEKQHGFAKPDIRVTLEATSKEGDKELSRSYPFVFVKPKPAAKEDDFLDKTLVQGGPDNLVFDVDAAQVKEIRNTINELRDKRLVAAGVTVSAISVKALDDDKKQLEAKKQGETWKLEKSSGVEVKTADGVEDLLQAITELKVDSFVDVASPKGAWSDKPTQGLAFEVAFGSKGKADAPSASFLITHQELDAGYLVQVDASEPFARYGAVVKKSALQPIRTLLGLDDKAAKEADRAKETEEEPSQ